MYFHIHIKSHECHQWSRNNLQPQKIQKGEPFLAFPHIAIVKNHFTCERETRLGHIMQQSSYPQFFFSFSHSTKANFKSVKTQFLNSRINVWIFLQKSFLIAHLREFSRPSTALLRFEFFSRLFAEWKPLLKPLKFIAHPFACWIRIVVHTRDRGICWQAWSLGKAFHAHFAHSSEASHFKLTLYRISIYKFIDILPCYSHSTRRKWFAIDLKLKSLGDLNEAVL
jgi:hypothetical protein